MFSPSLVSPGQTCLETKQWVPACLAIMEKGPMSSLATRSGNFSIEDILSKSPSDESTGGSLNSQISSSGTDFKLTSRSAVQAAKATAKTDALEENSMEGNIELFADID